MGRIFETYKECDMKINYDLKCQFVSVGCVFETKSILNTRLLDKNFIYWNVCSKCLRMYINNEMQWKDNQNDECGNIPKNNIEYCWEVVWKAYVISEPTNIHVIQSIMYSHGKKSFRKSIEESTISVLGSRYNFGHFLESNRAVQYRDRKL